LRFFLDFSQIDILLFVALQGVPLQLTLFGQVLLEDRIFLLQELDLLGVAIKQVLQLEDFEFSFDFGLSLVPE